MEKQPGWFGRMEGWQQLGVIIVGCLVVAFVFGVVGRLVGMFDAEESSGADDRGAEDVCVQFVEKRLKAPATAEYSNTTVMQGGGEWVVEGDVDSENGFGALIRSEFRCTVKPIDAAGTNWKLVDIEISE